MFPDSGERYLLFLSVPYYEYQATMQGGRPAEASAGGAERTYTRQFPSYEVRGEQVEATMPGQFPQRETLANARAQVQRAAQAEQPGASGN